MQSFTATRDAATEDELWLCTHPPVFTQGLSGKPEHLLTDIGVPVVQMDYQFAGGFSADPADKPGIANFTASLMDEGAGDLDALGFASRKEELGAQITRGRRWRQGLPVVAKNLEPSVALYADMLRKPRFEQADIDRVKGQWIAGIKQEKVQPSGVALRVLPSLMFGAGHPYGKPLSGTGTEAASAGLTRDDLVGFHQRMMQPTGASLIVVGDTTLWNCCRCSRSTSATGRWVPAAPRRRSRRWPTSSSRACS
jgi:predicted Zn-dependent peptidase